jgi:hypothetical protein
MAAAGLAAVMLWTSALPASAHYPVEPGGHAPRTDRAHQQQGAVLEAAPQPSRIALKLATGSIGYDISFPQCNGSFPKNAAFKIVGVNKGRAFDPNPCLGTGDGPSELQWAGRFASFYANTGSPGPGLSKRWPLGQRFPRRCATDAPLSKGCAYDYGWNAAKDSYLTAVRAYVSLGWAPSGATRTPVRNRWWLDVETSNSWRRNKLLNVATLQGAVAFLESRDVGFVGFYSARHMWESITGSTLVFSAYPSWMAGASTLRGALRYCQEIGFTGGRAKLSQFPKNGFDANVVC